MQGVPKSLRLQIAIFGRTNVGKSSLVNLISGQDVSIISDVAGTTTDIVEKSMELLPIGPVLLLDSAGLNDESQLGKKRIERTNKLFDRTDVAVLIVENGVWTEVEAEVCKQSETRKIPLITVINKIDKNPPQADFLNFLKEQNLIHILTCDASKTINRDDFLNYLKAALLQVLPDDFITPPPLLQDLVEPQDLVIMIVPIDLQAPKGRIILPQVQLIRDALDLCAIPIVCKESEYVKTLQSLTVSPKLIICDSQVVDFMVKNTPANIKCTTFSILFSRLKADLEIMAQGVDAIENLQDHDRVLIAESCTHHSTIDDIGRVKIPRWIQAKTGKNLIFDVHAGHDFPENLSDYKLIIQCGSCMLNRRETLSRVAAATAAKVPITNYGMAIAYTKDVFKRVMEPFRK